MGYGDFNLSLPNGETFSPDPQRVEAYKTLMIPGTVHLAPPASDREAWQKVADSRIGKHILEFAEEALSQDPLVYMTNELYEYTRTAKNRDRINPVMPAFRGRVSMLPIAEAIENKGRFLEQILKDIRALEELEHWNYPSNDDHRAHGTFVDLASTSQAANLVMTDHLHGSVLDDEVRTTIRKMVRKQIFQPFETGIKTGKEIYWWVVCDHNWNSVCMSYILQSALGLKQSDDERAWYLALAEKVLAYSEKGFEESGFYTEGLGYWNYGFAHYILGAELVRIATDGKVDWLTKPKVELTSRFGARLEIQDGLYPAFADCKSTAKPTNWVLHWLNNRIDPARTHRDTDVEIDPVDPPNLQNGAILQLVLFHQEDVDKAYARNFPSNLREWFEDVQFLISRPGPDSTTRMAATFKGGHNGVNHNHCDLGTFTVLVKDQELIVDPGAEEYTYRTFSEKRYHGDLLNSFGHPVPRINGDLQKPGKDDHRAGYGSEFFATVEETDFSEERDYVRLDLTRAYRVEPLEKLTREFTYSRGSTEKIEVVDTVAFSEPGQFESPIITFADWKQNEDGSLSITSGGQSVRVEIQTDDGELEFSHTLIQESSTPDRLAWAFKQPISQATIKFIITPIKTDE